MTNLAGVVQRIAAAAGWRRTPAAFGRGHPDCHPASIRTTAAGTDLPVAPAPADMLFNVAPLLLISSTVGGGREVWLAEAEHRVNNFAQLATSIAALRQRRVDAPHPVAHWVQAEALARAYARLNNPAGGQGGQATAALLDQIATGLVATFADPVGSVRLSFDCQEVLLVHAHRRALALILSELVVNALKYAFPAGRPGTISVSLHVTGPMVELVVADDGVGASGAGKVGQGKALLEQMTAMLSGTITRERIAAGGLRVAVHFPAGSGLRGDAIRCNDRAGQTRVAPFIGPGTAYAPT